MQLREEIKEKDIRIEDLEASLESIQEQLQQSHISIQELEKTNEKHVGNNSQISDLEKQVMDLQEQVLEKNKELKKKEQRLTDLKKTLQRELKVQGKSGDEPSIKRSQSPLRDQMENGNSNSRLSPQLPPVVNTRRDSNDHRGRSQSPPRVHEMNHLSSSSPAVLEDISIQEAAASRTFAESQHRVQSLRDSMSGRTSLVNSAADMNSLEKDVNFQYLKHVIIKFMLSRESEVSYFYNICYPLTP